MTCRKALAVFLGLFLTSSAFAQSYPNKPVRLVIAFTPGSTPDIIGRIVATRLHKIWGQPVVGDNRVGAGGSIGAAVVAKANADGYTLLANSSAHVSNPGIYANLAYDTLTDFTHLALLGSGPNVLITGTSTGWRKLADFISAAKASPGTLNFSSAGLGSGTHFTLEKFKTATGVDVIHIPYKGAPEAINDTIGGRVCCYWAPLITVLGHINSGKAHALAVSSAKRSSLLPNLATVAEQGYPGFDYLQWVGLWAPSGMPADIAAKINKDVNVALNGPDLRERLRELGTEPGNLTIPQFTQFVTKEVQDALHILKAAGVKPQ